jgi:hypothetical protein
MSLVGNDDIVAVEEEGLKQEDTEEVEEDLIPPQEEG